MTATQTKKLYCKKLLEISRTLLCGDAYPYGLAVMPTVCLNSYKHGPQFKSVSIMNTNHCYYFKIWRPLCLTVGGTEHVAKFGVKTEEDAEQ